VREIVKRLLEVSAEVGKPPEIAACDAVMAMLDELGFDTIFIVYRRSDNHQISGSNLKDQSAVISHLEQEIEWLKENPGSIKSV
jgi:hypothetical protein